MKKLMLPMCLLVMMSCSKKDDDSTPSTTTSTTSSGAVAFTKTNLVGTWEIKKEEIYNLANDSLTNSDIYPSGYLLIGFGSDDILTVTEDGDSNVFGVYSIAKKGNKSILVLSDGATGNDSNEVLSFTAKTMVLSDKMDAITWNDNSYSKIYLSKR